MKKIIIFLLIFFSVNSFSLKIKGSVMDEYGKPVANTPVFFIMKKVKFSFKAFKMVETDSAVYQTKTDQDGLYSLEVDIDPYFNRFYVDFVGDGFQYAKFSNPEPEDVTKIVDKGIDVVVNRVFKINPRWKDITLVLELIGENNPYSEVLKKYGFPDERVKLDDGREKWKYFEIGKEIIVGE